MHRLGYCSENAGDITKMIAIRQFQFDHGLTVDGVVGSKTQEMIQKCLDSGFVSDVLIPDIDITAFLGPAKYAVQEHLAGAREIGGNNKGPWVAKYHGVPEARLGDDWAWCAAFASWCFRQHYGEAMPMQASGSAQKLFKNASDSAQCVVFTDPLGFTPQVNDLIVWWRGETRSWKGHVEICLGLYGDMILTIGGNVGPYPSAVRFFVYSRYDMPKLIGFARACASTT